MVDAEASWLAEMRGVREVDRLVCWPVMMVATAGIAW